MNSNASGAQDEVATVPGSIVVGHDGSRQSDHALAVGLDLAQALAAPVVIVRAWSIDTAPRGTIFHDGYAASFTEITAVVRERLRAETADLVARYPGCSVEVRGALGQPSEVLIGASAGARMLVVGSRGLGGFAGLLLGSVSEHCVRQAPCPVLVVPAAG